MATKKKAPAKKAPAKKAPAPKKATAPAPPPAPPAPPERLFHGTARPFKVGDVILPRTQTGLPPNPSGGSNRPDVAHATPDVGRARQYAVSAADWAKKYALNEVEGGNREAKPFVYEVQPLGPEEGEWVERKSRSGIFREHVSPSGYQVIRNAWRMK